MAQISITKLRTYLMSLIDVGDLLAVQLVERYLSHEKNRRKLQTLLNKEGVENAVENQHQKYAKPHFALKEMRDIEKELQKIEDTLRKNKTPTEEKQTRAPLL